MDFITLHMHILYILIAIGAAAVLAACILIHLRKRKKEPSEPPVEEERKAGDFLEMFAKKHYMELDPTFTPKIIFNDFSGYFRGGSEQIYTHTQHVSIFDGGKSVPTAKCSTPSAKTFFRPLSACTPYRPSDTMPLAAKKLHTTG